MFIQNITVVHVIHIIVLCYRALCTFYSPDPTLTIENVMKVMEKVAGGKHKTVWRWCLGSDTLEYINSKCSTEKELTRTCSDVYVHCDPDSSWKNLARGLYHEEEAAAVEKVRSFLNPKGWLFSGCGYVSPSTIFDRVKNPRVCNEKIKCNCPNITSVTHLCTHIHRCGVATVVVETYVVL